MKYVLKDDGVADLVKLLWSCANGQGLTGRARATGMESAGLSES